MRSRVTVVLCFTLGTVQMEIKPQTLYVNDDWCQMTKLDRSAVMGQGAEAVAHSDEMILRAMSFLVRLQPVHAREDLVFMQPPW